MMKRIYFLLLTAIACCQLSISQTVLRVATEGEATPEHLYLVGGLINTHNPNWLLEDAIKLEVDAEWVPIGAADKNDVSPQPFKGIFDGKAPTGGTAAMFGESRIEKVSVSGNIAGGTEIGSIK
jgi:hypothetical protein